MKVLKQFKRGLKWWCTILCACGKKKDVRRDHIKVIKGCGCLRGRPTHNMSDTPTYTAWEAIIQRCTNPNSVGFHLWGGRGIKVCKRWRKFENFLVDMGEKPPKHDIGRVNNNGNYKPSNCVWQTRKENLNNTRRNVFVRWNGKRLTVTQLAELVGIRYGTLRYRIVDAGWPVNKAISGSVWANMKEVS